MDTQDMFPELLEAALKERPAQPHHPVTRLLDEDFEDDSGEENPYWHWRDDAERYASDVRQPLVNP